MTLFSTTDDHDQLRDSLGRIDLGVPAEDESGVDRQDDGCRQEKSQKLTVAAHGLAPSGWTEPAGIRSL